MTRLFEQARLMNQLLEWVRLVKYGKLLWQRGNLYYFNIHLKPNMHLFLIGPGGLYAQPMVAFTIISGHCYHIRSVLFISLEADFWYATLS